MDDGTKMLLMRSDWNDFFARNQLVGSAPDFFDQIATRHAEPTRHYHTFLGHVFDLATKLKGLHHLVDNPDLVYFFAMTHDAIYDSTKSDNEAQSAAFAATLGAQMGLGDAFLSTVASYIIASGYNGLVLPPSRDLDLSLDLDLSILGDPEPIFDEYERNIAKEYSWAPQADYRAARAGILQGFLDKGRIYRTEHFHQTHQLQAEKNLQRSIDLLLNTSE